MSSYPKQGYRPSGKGRVGVGSGSQRRPLPPFRPTRPPAPKLPTKFNPRSLGLGFVTKGTVRKLPLFKFLDLGLYAAGLASAFYIGAKAQSWTNPGNWRVYVGCPRNADYVTSQIYRGGCLVGQALATTPPNNQYHGYWRNDGTAAGPPQARYEHVRSMEYWPGESTFQQPVFTPARAPMQFPAPVPANVPAPLPAWLPGLIPGLYPPGKPGLPDPVPIPYPLVPHKPRPVYPTDPDFGNEVPGVPVIPGQPQTPTVPSPWTPPVPEPWPHPFPEPNKPPVVIPPVIISPPVVNPNPGNPGTNPNPNPNPGTGAPRPPMRPGKGEKEKKVKSGLSGLGGYLFGLQSEFNDAVNALYEALPRNLRHYGRDRGPLAKLKQIYKHINDMDGKRAVANLIANQIEDSVFGKLGKASEAFGEASGLTHGIGHGGKERRAPQIEGLPKGKDLADYIYEWL